MKKLLLLSLFLFFLVLFGRTQGYFSSEYVHSGIGSAADGYVIVEYHNHINPVKYTLVLGGRINGVDDFFDITSDTIIHGDSVSNVIIISDSNHIPGHYDGFKAFAIDSITLDTLGVIKSLQLGDSYNEIGLNNIMGSFSQSNCNGSFDIDTLAYYNTSNSNSNSYLRSHLKYHPNYSSDSLITVFQSNNQNDISIYPNFEGDSLCPGYYEFACSNGFIVSFTITGTSVNHLTANDVAVTETPYLECYNSASVAINHSSGPYTYSWDGGLFDSNNLKGELCSGSHSLTVANSFGDTVLLTPFIHTLSFITTISTLNACLGKAEIHINSNYLDASSFQYSWSGGDFSSEINTDSLCSGVHELLIVDGFGDTLIQSFTIDILEFYLGTFSDSNTCAGSANLVPEGDLFAFFPFTGGDSIYISWNQSPFELYAPENQSIDSLCEGIYSVAITGAVLGYDTVVFPFAVANSANTFNNVGNTSANGSVSYYIDDCTIDYTTSIDSVSIASFNFIDSTHVIYVVDVWQLGILTQINDTVLCYLDSVDILNVSLTFYCSLKSNSDVFKVVDNISTSSEVIGTSFIEHSEMGILIFPNPTNNILNIQVDDSESFLISLYNSNGQLMLTSREIKLDVSQLPKGLYFLNYTSESRNEVIKIVKN